MAAVELGLFEALAKGPKNAEALTNQLGLNGRGARDFFDALVALKLLDRDDSPHAHAHDDHNWRAAYVPVAAAALTSVLAIVALLTGTSLGWTAVDPLMGVVGAGLIVHWATGLCRDAAGQLLDVLPSTDTAQAMRRTLEAIDDLRIADLHLWAVGPGRMACIVSLVSAAPRETSYYRDLILSRWPLAHLTVELHQCRLGHAA